MGSTLEEELSKELETLRARALQQLVEVSTVRDRILVHLEKVPQPTTSETKTALDPKLASWNLERERDEALTVFFGPSRPAHSAKFQSAFRPSDSWAAGIEIESLAGTRLGLVRKAVDLVRIEKFKTDFKKAVLQALERDLAQSSKERWHNLLQQLWEDLRRIATGVEEVQEQARQLREESHPPSEQTSAEDQAQDDLNKEAHARRLRELEEVAHQARKLREELAATG